MSEVQRNDINVEEANENIARYLELHNRTDDFTTLPQSNMLIHAEAE